MPTTTDSTENVAQTMRDVISDLAHHDHIANPEQRDLAAAHLITLPEKRRVHDISAALREAAQYLKPARRRGTAHLADLASLINWANRFKGAETVLYANPDMDAPTLTCIADYHAAGEADVHTPTGDPTARHLAHRAIYDFPLSEDWKAWMRVDGKPLDKDTMGEFIEAQAKDVMDPTPAILKGAVTSANAPWENRLIETAQKIEGRFGQLSQLLAMSRQFQVYETSNLKVSTNRDTGESEVQFLSEHKTPDGKPLNIPNLIIIAIPVFQGGAPYRMPVRFRYRKVGGEVRFILSVYNPEKAFEAAFNEAIEQARDQTELPTFMGLPEKQT